MKILFPNYSYSCYGEKLEHLKGTYIPKNKIEESFPIVSLAQVKQVKRLSWVTKENKVVKVANVKRKGMKLLSFLMLGAFVLGTNAIAGVNDVEGSNVASSNQNEASVNIEDLDARGESVQTQSDLHLNLSSKNSTSLGSTASGASSMNSNYPSRKFSVGASIARDVFPSELDKESEDDNLNNVNGKLDRDISSSNNEEQVDAQREDDDVVIDPIVLVRDPSLLEQKAKLPRDYNAVKKFNQEWLKLNKEICFIEPVKTLRGAYCMQDRLRELDNMYLVAKGDSIKDSCFYENPRDMANHSQSCYFYGELTECLDEERPFNCMENVLATVLADHDASLLQKGKGSPAEKVLYSCSTNAATEKNGNNSNNDKGSSNDKGSNTDDERLGLLAIYPASEMPFVILHELKPSELKFGVNKLSARYGVKPGLSLYMYPENRGAFYSESIFEVLGRSYHGTKFTETKSGAIYTTKNGVRFACSFKNDNK